MAEDTIINIHQGDKAWSNDQLRDAVSSYNLVLKSAKEFAAGELRDISRDCDEEDTIPAKTLDKAWEIGLANASVPEVYDGIGMERSAVTSVLVCEELAYGCATLATAILAPSTFINPIIDFGTDDQKKKYLPSYAHKELLINLGSLK